MKNFLPFFLFFTIVQSCSSVSNPSQELMAKVDSLQNELNKYTSAEDLNKQRLTRFDSLDFDINSNQKWDELSVSHSDNIVVYYPDGSTAIGLDPQHIDALKPMFVFAPDTKIKTHPVRVAGGNWTAVIGVMEGAFSQPMPLGKGRFLKPTGRKFKLKMCTVGHWKGGKMAEEHLFWDNAAFMKQIGAGS